MKLIYTITLLLSLGLFNSCGEKIMIKDLPEQEFKIEPRRQEKRPDNVYGAYLAGRVAHMRQNFNMAADYYIKSLNLGTQSEDLVSNVYLLLASEGRIKESAEYALKAHENGDKSNLISFVLMTEDMAQNNFDQAFNHSLLIEDKPFKDTILPLFQAWILAAQNKRQEAFETLDKLKKEKSLLPLYHLHRGMLGDYFDDDKDAVLQDYEYIVNDEKMPLSFRSLQVIGNFYLRAGLKEKIVDLAQKYSDQNNKAPMMEALVDSFKNADEKKLKKYIDTPQKGFAEAMFNVGTIFRGYQNEAAQLFMALVLYLNPDFEVARISLADLYEQAHRYQKATDEYLKIEVWSPVYFIAQMKAASDYAELKQDEKALKILEDLLKKYPKNNQLTFRLGELNRSMERYEESVSFYQKTLDGLPLYDTDRWLIYYALGISFEREKKWNEAEDAFKNALELSGRHPLVLNYLGYLWIERGINTNEALFMIFEAHRKNSEDGHIIDSLGWALYKMGKYDEAVKVLERASEYLPANAVVFDHLGDAYWQAGRKNEARFQWRHALSATQDKDDVDQQTIRLKIEQGLAPATPLLFNEEVLMERLKALDAK